jgi:hypothetical protein
MARSRDSEIGTGTRRELADYLAIQVNPLPLPRGSDSYFFVALFAFAAIFSAFAAE